jgi:hypothetical protein
MMWSRLQKEHPIIYELIQWGVIALGLASIIISVISIAAKLGL